ncbi:MAG: hypothetical protein Q9190_004119 [Brigantiaea leucoxantha]
MSTHTTSQDNNNIAESFYDNAATHTFYSTLWGGEDIHIGIYSRDSSDIRSASHHSEVYMASCLSKSPTQFTRILDLGSGFGGAARYLASTFGCRVTCLNLSEVQNTYNRQKNKEQGLEHLIEVVKGNYEDTKLQAHAYDVVWSQDAFLHSRNRAALVREMERLLIKEGGEVVFTDNMAGENADPNVLEPVLRRLQVNNLETVKGYRKMLEEMGFQNLAFEDLSENLAKHYQKVLDELVDRREELIGEGKMDGEALDRVKEGLNGAVTAAKTSHYVWGVLRCHR